MKTLVWLLLLLAVGVDCQPTDGHGAAVGLSGHDMGLDGAIPHNDTLRMPDWLDALLHFNATPPDWSALPGLILQNGSTIPGLEDFPDWAQALLGLRGDKPVHDLPEWANHGLNANGTLADLPHWVQAFLAYYCPQRGIVNVPNWVHLFMAYYCTPPNTGNWTIDAQDDDDDEVDGFPGVPRWVLAFLGVNGTVHGLPGWANPHNSTNGAAPGIPSLPEWMYGLLGPNPSLPLFPEFGGPNVTQHPIINGSDSNDGHGHNESAEDHRPPFPGRPGLNHSNSNDNHPSTGGMGDNNVMTDDTETESSTTLESGVLQLSHGANSRTVLKLGGSTSGFGSRVVLVGTRDDLGQTTLKVRNWLLVDHVDAMELQNLELVVDGAGVINDTNILSLENASLVLNETANVTFASGLTVTGSGHIHNHGNLIFQAGALITLGVQLFNDGSLEVNSDVMLTVPQNFSGDISIGNGTTLRSTADVFLDSFAAVLGAGALHIEEGSLNVQGGRVGCQVTIRSKRHAMRRMMSPPSIQGSGQIASDLVVDHGLLLVDMQQPTSIAGNLTMEESIMIFGNVDVTAMPLIVEGHVMLDNSYMSIHLDDSVCALGSTTIPLIRFASLDMSTIGVEIDASCKGSGLLTFNETHVMLAWNQNMGLPVWAIILLAVGLTLCCLATLVVVLCLLHRGAVERKAALKDVDEFFDVEGLDLPHLGSYKDHMLFYEPGQAKAPNPLTPDISPLPSPVPPMPGKLGDTPSSPGSRCSISDQLFTLEP